MDDPGPKVTDSPTWVRTVAPDEGQETVSQVLEAVLGLEAPQLRCLGVIGRGGMGQVESAFDGVLQRTVARKSLHPSHRAAAGSTRGLIREAQVTGQLDHPNIVPVHELAFRGEQLFFTMKQVHGSTLSEWVAELPSPQRTRAELLDLLDIVIKVCDALSLAHSRGVIHCDVKPENVMVGDFGEVYLMDWGVARLLSESDVAASGTQHQGDDPVGTPAYMSAEQARGDALDFRTDLFGVAALVYFGITGRGPYHQPNVATSLLQASVGRYPSISSLVGQGVIPGQLLDILRGAMSTEPQQRPQSAQALKAQLVQFVRGGGGFPSVAYESGQTIIAEGEVGDAAYIIEQGLCSVYKGQGQAQTLLREMGPGEVFGETAILAACPRTATVVAKTAVRVMAVNRAVLEAELEGLKPWMARLVRTLAQRFGEQG